MRLSGWRARAAKVRRGSNGNLEFDDEFARNSRSDVSEAMIEGITRGFDGGHQDETKDSDDYRAGYALGRDSWAALVAAGDGGMTPDLLRSRATEMIIDPEERGLSYTEVYDLADQLERLEADRDALLAALGGVKALIFVPGDENDIQPFGWHAFADHDEAVLFAQGRDYRFFSFQGGYDWHYHAAKQPETQEGR